MTPTDDDLIAAVSAIAEAHLDWRGPLSRDTKLVETLGLDSLRRLTLLVEIEDRFRISFDEEDESAILTVGDLLDTIRRKRGEAHADAR